jgi:hypothetical protein
MVQNLLMTGADINGTHDKLHTFWTNIIVKHTKCVYNTWNNQPMNEWGIPNCKENISNICEFQMWRILHFIPLFKI